MSSHTENSDENVQRASQSERVHAPHVPYIVNTPQTLISTADILITNPEDIEDSSSDDSSVDENNDWVTNTGDISMSTEAIFSEFVVPVGPAPERTPHACQDLQCPLRSFSETNSAELPEDILTGEPVAFCRLICLSDNTYDCSSIAQSSVRLQTHGTVIFVDPIRQIPLSRTVYEKVVSICNAHGERLPLEWAQHTAYIQEKEETAKNLICMADVYSVLQPLLETSQKIQPGQHEIVDDDEEPFGMFETMEKTLLPVLKHPALQASVTDIAIAAAQIDTNSALSSLENCFLRLKAEGTPICNSISDVVLESKEKVLAAPHVSLLDRLVAGEEANVREILNRHVNTTLVPLIE